MRSPFARRFGLASPFLDNEDGFRPSQLFADGGNGILWDFTATGPLFTDSAGTTPLTAAEQTIGMVRDGSRTRSPITAYAGVQASAGLRPPYGIAPASRRQLLTYSEDFANAAWSVSTGGTGSLPTITANYGIAPDGTATAARVQLDKGAGTTSADISQWNGPIVNQIVGVPFVSSVWFKTNDGSTKAVIVVDPAGVGQLINVTGTWQQFSVSAVAAATTNRPRIRLRGNEFTATTADILYWHPQWEAGSTATAYQKSVTALEITETGFATYGYTQPDRNDDILSTVLTLAQTGDVMVFGRNGSWLETGRVYGAGATFSVGLNSNGAGATSISALATLNILRAVGDVLGIVAMGRASTAAEQASAMAYFRARGAAGFLAVSGAELVTNGDFASGTTGWTANAAATISNVANRLRITALAATPDAYTSFATVIGQSYLLTATYVTDAITGNAFVYAGINATDSSNLSLDLGSTVGTYTATFVATATTTFVRLSGNPSALITETMDWDNVSCKLLVAS
jgi:hypothetical protein